MLKSLLKRKYIILIALILGIIFTVSVVALADEPVSNTTEIKLENPIGTDKLDEIIYGLINFLLGVALVVCPLVIVVGGFYFITSGGSPEKANKGRQIMMYAAIGLVIILISRALVAAVQKAVGFEP